LGRRLVSWLPGLPSRAFPVRRRRISGFAPSWRAGSFGYKDLADKLAPTGVKETERNLSNKINRGSFTAVFFLQCMEAIGVDTLHLKG